MVMKGDDMKVKWRKGPAGSRSRTLSGIDDRYNFYLPGGEKYS
jgi:hypothetical protein